MPQFVLSFIGKPSDWQEALRILERWPRPLVILDVNTSSLLVEAAEGIVKELVRTYPEFWKYNQDKTTSIPTTRKKVKRSTLEAGPKPDPVPVVVTEKDMWLAREAIAFACREGPFSKAKKQRLATLCENVILRAILRPTPK